MTTPQWSELTDAVVLGRPVKVWRRRPATVNAMMRLSAGRDDDAFLVQGDRRFTFARFRQAVEAGAAELRDLGVRPGDGVLIVLYNSPEFWLLQCAVWRLGAVPVLGNRWWSLAGLADAQRRIAPALTATDMAEEGVPRLTPEEIARWWTLPAPATPAPDPDGGVDEDDVAAVVFTAGSTGAPKCVQLSHRALVWTQQTVQVLRGGRPPVPPAPGAQKVALCTTPLFHNGGMVAALGSLIEGARMVFLAGRFDPAEALRLIEAERVTSWSAVPTMFSRLVRHPDLPARDLSSLVAPASGGAAVTPEFVREVGDKLPAAAAGFSSGYGMTEMSFVTLAGASDIVSRPGAVGRLAPGVELRVDAPDADGGGELLVRSAAMMIGYLGEDAQPIDPEGWYHTGDLGRIDDDGVVRLTGRCKDQVIRGGENIACGHVEAALLTHADVLEAAVVGVPDPEFGEAVAAVVHLRPEAVFDPEAMGRHARARLAYFETPTRWMRRDAPLPVLPTGKIDKAALRRDLLATASAAASPPRGPHA